MSDLYLQSKCLYLLFYLVQWLFLYELIWTFVLRRINALLIGLINLSNQSVIRSSLKTFLSFITSIHVHWARNKTVLMLHFDSFYSTHEYLSPGQPKRSCFPAFISAFNTEHHIQSSEREHKHPGGDEELLSLQDTCIDRLQSGHAVNISSNMSWCTYPQCI